jgi:hypothetical protein
VVARRRRAQRCRRRRRRSRARARPPPSCCPFSSPPDRARSPPNPPPPLPHKTTTKNNPDDTPLDGWEKRWVKSSWKSKSKEAGEWKHSAGKWFGGDESSAKGLQTSPDSKFHAISAELKKAVGDTTGKELVLQYSVKHEQDLDCGGGYIKLVPGSVAKGKMKEFGGDTPYSM